MADFTWVADYDADEATMPKVLVAQFGDGYKQRAPDGLNNQLRTWNWAFNNVSEAVAGDIIAFLKAKNGVTEFTHELPGSGEVVTVLAPSWNKRWSGFQSYNITAKFEEVISIGV